jgi:hypothetical protein
MKRIITISYVLDSPIANTIGQDPDPEHTNLATLIHFGLKKVVGESYQVSDVFLVNERMDLHPVRDAFEACWPSKEKT